MNDQVTATFWIAAPALAVGTWLLRSAFLAYFTSRRLSPEWERALKYTPAALLPAIGAPLVMFDAAGALQSDPARILGAAAALVIGLATRNVLWTICGGMATVWAASAVQALL